ncbi:MAG: PQQ-binding-like beta-propeller repeat protein, partial [Pseudomonadota bacterium]
GFATATINDLQGDPVVSNGVLYAGTHAGRSAAIDITTGRQVWSTDEGAMSAPVVTPNSVFQVTDRNALVRLDAATGQTVWLAELPLYTASRERRRRDFFTHFGPVLAGGRLWVASDDDVLRAFDPNTGAQIGEVALPGAAASNPIVAGSTLYIVTANGQIHALR